MRPHSPTGVTILTRAVCVSICFCAWMGLACGAEVARRERVIVMTSGRVISGVLTRNVGGWLVEQQNGRVQVPEDQVKVVADSLPDAYRKQRDAIAEPTPATHVMLAQWCISFHLYDEARDELKQCLKRDPDHEEARRLLHKVEQALNPKTAAPKTVDSLKTAEGFLLPEVESLGGLSRETATMFTSRVQPLLINKCGNASCHGSNSNNGFKLSVVRIGGNGHRIHSERNLAEALKLIDIQNPGQSRLLTVPQGNHGGALAMFSGAGGPEQVKTLRTFIKQVSQEKRKVEEELAARPSVIAKKKSSSSTESTSDESDSVDEDDSEPRYRKGRPTPDPEPVVKTAPAAEQTPSKKTNPVEQASFEQASSEESDSTDDPFDPNQFNRRYHGSTVKSKSPR